MLRPTIDNFIKGNRACGLEIIFSGEACLEFNAVILKRQKSIISIEKQTGRIKTIEELGTILDPKLPLVIVCNGKGIIHRKVAATYNDTLNVLLNKALPNANASDFYLQRNSLDESQAFISVVRSSLLDDVLMKLQQSEITNIAFFSLGPFILNDLLPLLDHTLISNEKLQFAGYSLLIREDRIHDILPAGQEDVQVFSMANERIGAKTLIAFSAALSYFTGLTAGIENSETINSIRDELKQKQLFHFAGWSLLIIAFIILTANYFAFNNYWTKGNRLSTELTLNQSALNRYDTLKKEYLIKKVFLEDNGMLENSQTSFYADRLAKDLPESIQWLDLNIHPLRKKDPADETNALFFENKKILVSGKSQRSTELNEWMKKIKKKDWIADVILMNYKQDNAKDAGLFLIEIKLK